MCIPQAPSALPQTNIEMTMDPRWKSDGNIGTRAIEICDETHVE